MLPLYISSHLERIKRGFNIKYGYFRNLSSNFGFQWFLGLGWAFQTNTYSNTIPTSTGNTPLFDNIYRNKELGSINGLNITLGFKIFFKFIRSRNFSETKKNEKFDPPVEKTNHRRL